MDSAEFAALTEEFFEAYFGFYPTEGAEAGLHAYDAVTGPRDAAAIEAYVAHLREIERRLAGIDGSLDSDQSLDRDLVLRHVRSDLFWLDEEAKWRRDPRFYVSQMDLSFLLLSTHAPLHERMESIVARLEVFPALVRAARDNVAEAPLPFVQTALVNYGGLPAFLRGDLTAALAPVKDPDLQARFATARDAAADAVDDYAAHLEREILPNAGDGFALGPERFRRLNALLTGVDLPIERLEAIGRAELARLQVLGESLAMQVAPGRGLEGGFEALGVDSAPVDGLVEEAASDVERLVAFLDGAEIGTRLPGAVEVKEIPAFRRTNFAYIIIPGPFDAARTAFYFIHPVEEGWSDGRTADFLRRNNRWSILNTSVHEAYPGHYHHFQHINRAPTKAQRLLTSYVTIEGWAHYAEEMAWREGLADSSPRLGLAVVQDALLRVVRYLSAIGLHTQGMSVEEAEEMFRTLGHQDALTARQQALRGTYDPQYLNYTLGKLMIHELRDDLRRARGRELDLRSFHDEFMACGAPPVPWIARRLLDDPGWEPFR